MENHSSPAFFVHNFALAITKKRWLRGVFLPSFFDLLIQTNTTLFPISPPLSSRGALATKDLENTHVDVPEIFRASPQQLVFLPSVVRMTKEEGNTPDAKTNENQMRITKSSTLNTYML